MLVRASAWRRRSHRRDRRHRVIPPSLAPSTRLGSLLKRVLATDVLVCDACGGAMRILAILPDGDASRAILEHLRLPTEPGGSPTCCRATDRDEAASGEQSKLAHRQCSLARIHTKARII
jgi:hypothetical protein